MGSETPIPPSPTLAEANALFADIEKKFPHKSVGEDRWYLLAVSALVGCEPNFVPALYTYLIQKPNFATPASRQQLTRRLREALVKDVSILGVCKPLEAIFGISKIEKEEDRDYSFSRQDWKSGPENEERGSKWLNTIYLHNHGKTDEALAAHKDFSWISRNITYGLYLSDHTILGPIETELVVLAGIMIQNLPLETGWHLRGARRVGISKEDVETIHQCIELVAKFAHVSLHKVPRVADIEHEV